MIDFKEKIKKAPLFKKAVTLSRAGRRADYERLEFLGDRVLGVCIADMLYHQFKNELEGALAHRFTDLVREETLAIIARKLGVPDLLITNENELRDNDSVLADVCEALIGALFLTDGFDTVRHFIDDHWHDLMMSYRHAPKDAKSALQEWTQQHFGKLPVYKIIDQTGPDHHPVFRVEARIETYAQIGEGPSKKNAEQIAARLLLQELKA